MDDTLPPPNTRENTSTDLNALSLKLPPFWTNSPKAWFSQCESQFNIYRITNEQRKYHYIVASLPQDVANTISDLLETPPENNMYSDIKAALIDRYSLSIERSVKQLISNEEVGDRTPSEFYRYLKHLAGPCAAPGEELIKKIWASRLPNLVNIAVIQSKDLPFTSILEMADKVNEALQVQNVSNIATPLSQASGSATQTDRISKLENQISELKCMISKINLNRPSRSQSRQRNDNSFSRTRSSSRKRFSPKGSMCWYHFKFGTNAQKCVAPCNQNKTRTTTN